jgi:hypothetical protein
MKKKTTIVFSINVHENVKFLQKQIEDIEANVLLDFVVLINANEFMYNEIINNKPLMARTAKASKATKAFIELYPEPINKIHNHGTLTKGIYLNMEYAVRNYDFEYFIVLSSRNLFYNTLHKDNYHAMPRISYGATIEQLNYQEWHWRIFLQTKLGHYIIANNWRFCQPYMHHEGLGFDYASSTQIVDFLEKNKDIKEDLFNFNWGVEEFALHSIVLNLTGYYYNIGNWTNDDDFVNIHKLPSDRFVYKTFRR